MPRLFIGLMAGTSGDGIDAVLADFTGATPRVLAWHYHPYPNEIREQVLDLAAAGDDRLDRVASADQQLAELFAAAALEVMRAGGVEPAQVTAIGSHGQTVRHQAGGPWPYTVQIADPNRIAERTGVTTVADFRRRDMAAGGEGAPLAPAFHRHVFARPQRSRAVLNLGGMANLTLLPAAGAVTGFDTGPGNAVMDSWFERHRQGRYDTGGEWAASGRVLPELLDRLLAHPFFDRPPPKSCGREEFNLEWLMASLPAGGDAGDVQATLSETTARSVARSLHRYLPDCEDLVVCGGGVHNHDLMRRLRGAVGEIAVRPSSDCGVDPDQVEALAFAWLAARALDGLPGNIPAVSGARGERILGAIHPA